MGNQTTMTKDEQVENTLRQRYGTDEQIISCFGLKIGETDSISFLRELIRNEEDKNV